ncbi:MULTISPECIES: hypothetical protein [Virgibacillus]|uniref:LysM domain-containing protein n=1 Tax=Virgibacillus dokdonensis TaxID=302167 RepID=A0ABU7VEE7_9BACI|nr:MULTISPECIES: hypothetical protein [Virgibacillus]NWO12387.1 hypothetical protein [Virgibacillus sp.]
MDFPKKLFSLFICIMAIYIIYQDITQESPHSRIELEKHSDMISPTMFHVVPVKVEPNDTVLSIVEQINPNIQNELNVKRILNDFKLSNPNADPFSLTTGKIYYFPKYSKTLLYDR